MEYQKVYMVGIGGIGMSALAQLFQHQGVSVSGSDRGESPTTELLRKKGVAVFIGHDAAHVPEDIDALIYSDAVTPDNPERLRAQELGVPQFSYFDALGKAAEGKRVISIAGTHGKTTTTAMIAKMLIDAGADPTVVIGSISADLGSNFRAGNSNIFVVEACEYRRHFLNFRPEVLVITNIEFDHTDYFRSLEDVVAAFRESAAQVVKGGSIVANPAQESVARAVESSEAPVIDYSLERATKLSLPGEFNLENARAAKAAVRLVAPGVPESAMDASLKAFRGTWRRFEHKGVVPGGAQLYDDYAHHPTAVRKTIAAAREKFPGKRIAVVFHPHLYSRTRDLFDEFVGALATADEAYILPVFAAREPHDPSVSHEALAAAVTAKGGMAAALGSLKDAAQAIAGMGPDVVVFTMGAGDVYKAGEQALKQ